jgi:hypothetical protein
MRNRLLIFGRFAHDSDGILAAIHQFALMSIECGVNFHRRLVWVSATGFELSITAFADPECQGSFLYDPKAAYLHDFSLAHLAKRA